MNEHIYHALFVKKYSFFIIIILHYTDRLIIKFDVWFVLLQYNLCEKGHEWCQDSICRNNDRQKVYLPILSADVDAKIPMKALYCFFNAECKLVNGKVLGLKFRI